MTTPTGALLDELDDDDLDRLARRLATRITRPPDDDRLYTAKEAALYLRCRTPERIYDLVRAGDLEPVRDGRRLLFRRRELERRLAENP